MKILKIREGKWKLTLTAEEAQLYGLGRGRTISNKDLCATVRRLLKSQMEGEGWEKLLVETYPKMDGSYDIFVSGEPIMEKRTGKSTFRYYGFESAEHLAFALYVLAKSKTVSPLAGEGIEEEGHHPSVEHNIVTEHSTTLGEHTLPKEVYDLFFHSESKTENPECEHLPRKLSSLCLYRTENLHTSCECYSFILAIDEADTQAVSQLLFLCEFGKELSKMTEELLMEHTSRISITELFPAG